MGNISQDSLASSREAARNTENRIRRISRKKKEKRKEKQKTFEFYTGFVRFDFIIVDHVTLHSLCVHVLKAKKNGERCFFADDFARFVV